MTVHVPTGYPRPQLVRDSWHLLDGTWEFAIDHDGRWRSPADVEWNSKIVVPFSPETEASGIGARGLYRACWYRRQFEAPKLAPGERLILHFGAVDYAATVWVNGHAELHHHGGYTPFEGDITRALRGDGPQEIVVWALDEPTDLTKPRGKQDWQEKPHSIWYPRTTGIWQSVWTEVLPRASVRRLRWTPSIERWELSFEAEIEGEISEGLRLDVRLDVDGQLLAEDSYGVVGRDITRRVALSDPGIDDFRNDLLWSPASPTLINADITLRTSSGEAIDRVRSYAALRSVGVSGDRFMLNGRPFRLRMVLDQGYWPETGATPPDDAALRRDIELVRQMGFNGVRKHQKLEDPRYLAWADRLGLVVWGEMPSAYRFTRRSVERLTREWSEAIDRDSGHPCIVTWVPFNESWGVPDLPETQQQQHFVHAMYRLTKTLDPTRPVVGNDGWEAVATDIIGVHDYDDDVERLAERYGSHEAVPQLLRNERPEGRMLRFEDGHDPIPIMLTEFGGLSCSTDPKTWGYVSCTNPEELQARYERLLAVVHGLPALTGFCYTQFCDTYQEANGLLMADRTPKFPLEAIAKATRGPTRYRDEQIEREWAERRARRRAANQVPDV